MRIKCIAISLKAFVIQFAKTTLVVHNNFKQMQMLDICIGNVLFTKTTDKFSWLPVQIG